MNRAEANKLILDLNDSRKNLKQGFAIMSGCLEVCLAIMLDDSYTREQAGVVSEIIREDIAKWSNTPPEPGSYNALFNTQNHDNATAPVPPITDLAAETVIPVSDRQ